MPMKTRSSPLLAAALLALQLVRPASADTIYSNLQNIAIPTTFAGVYLDLDTGTTSTSSFTGWDINPFYGGVGISNSAAFQPVRTGTGNLDAVLNLAAGSVISGSLTFSTGIGGSGDDNAHIGAAGNQFQVGTSGYLGFKFTTNNSSVPLYGWMGVTLTNDVGGAVIKDWGYDDAGGSIVTARVQQGAASGGAQTVTLSPAIGESFTLGSAITNTSGNINSVIKTGEGTTILKAANTYTGATAVNAGTLRINGVNSGSGAVTVSSGATLGGSGTVGGATTISGTHSVGSAAATVGTQNFSSTLTYASGSIFEWDLSAATSDPGAAAANSGTYDQVVSAGAITGGSAVFKIVLGTNTYADAFWNTNKSWTNIFSGAGTPASLSAVFNSFSGTGLVAGVAAGEGQFSFNGSTSTLNWTAVPEPTSALAGLLLGAGLLRRRRTAGTLRTPTRPSRSPSIIGTRCFYRLRARVE